MDLTFDDGNLPSVLALLGRQQTLQLMADTAAKTYEHETRKWIDLGNAFTPRTGNLQNSIGWRSEGHAESVIYASAEYAAWVEFGTEPHVIEAKNAMALKIPKGDGFYFAKRVNHPGSRPHPYFFADQHRREQSMQTNMVSVLAQQIDNV